MMNRTDTLVDKDLKQSCENFIKKFDSLEIAFRNAANQGRLDVIRFIAPQIDVNAKGEKSGDNALHVACRSNQTLAIKLLLELGVRSDLANAKGEYPNVAEKLGYSITSLITKNKPVIINTFGLNGIGDFIYALRAHQACRRRLPSNIPIKSILTFSVAGDATPALLAAIKGDISPDEIYIYDIFSGKEFDEEKALKKSFIIFIAKNLVMNDELIDKARTYTFIANRAPKFHNFIKNCRLYLNFGTSLSDYPQFNSHQPEKCFSFLEIGDPPENAFQFLLKVTPPSHTQETELNLFKGDAGLMLDESLLDLMESMKPEELTVHDFKNKSLFSAISKTKGHFLVGYMQHFYSLATLIATHHKKSNDLKILTNINLLLDHSLNQYPFNQFAVINLFDPNGIKTTHKNEKGKGELNLFPFNGLTSQDKRRYLLLADSTLGSGDNSFIESICVGKPFYWDIPLYKIPAMSQWMAWCCENQLFHVAKLIYVNCLLTQPIYFGVISEEQLSGYSEFLNKYWNEIVSEVSALKKIIMKSANFNNYLERVLKDEKCNPLEFQQTNIPKPQIEGRSAQKPSLLNSQSSEEMRAYLKLLLSTQEKAKQREIEITRLGNESLAFILNIQDPKLLLSHVVKAHVKQPALFSLYLKKVLAFVAKDDQIKLGELILRSPLIDLMQKIEMMGDITLLDFVKKNNASKCFELLSEEIIKREQADSSVACKKVFVDYINHIGSKNKKNYQNLVEALGKNEYAKALCIICNSQSAMKAKFAELLCCCKNYFEFDINQPIGAKNTPPFTTLHYKVI